MFMSNIVLNLTLAPGDSWIQKSSLDASGNPVNPLRNDGTYTLTNCRILCDEVVLDPGLVSELATRLSSSRINIPLNVFNSYSLSNPITVKDPSFQIARSLSKLKQIYVTLKQDTSQKTKLKSAVSEMYYPQGAKVQFRVQIGSKLYPAYNAVGADSLQEFLYRLELSSATHNSQIFTHGLSKKMYFDDDERAFLIALDMEKTLHQDAEVDFTGMDLSNSPAITLSFKNLQGPGTTDNEKPPTEAHVFLFSSAILSLALNDIQLLE